MFLLNTVLLLQGLVLGSVESVLPSGGGFLFYWPCDEWAGKIVTELGITYGELLAARRSTGAAGDFIQVPSVVMATGEALLCPCAHFIVPYFVCVEDEGMLGFAVTGLGEARREIEAGDIYGPLGIEKRLMAFLSFCPSGLVPVLNDSAENHRRNVPMEIDWQAETQV